MQNNFLHFQWGVPDQGYYWDADAKPDEHRGADPRSKAPFLVEQLGSRELDMYNPLERRMAQGAPLFVRFSQLGNDPAEILAFANKYGWLGVAKPLYKDKRTFRGESLARWRQEIRELHRAVEVWQAAQSTEKQDRDFLRSIFTWERDAETVSVDMGGAWELLTRRADYRQELYDSMVSGDAIVPAWAAKAFLLVTVNQYFKNSENSMVPCLLFSDRHRNLAGYLRPRDLLSALWLQFYQAIVGERLVRRCAYCRGLMEVPKGSRSTKVLHERCGNAKKMAAYRQRQRKAKAMAEGGAPIKQIAEKLGTNKRTVKKWIS